MVHIKKKILKKKNRMQLLKPIELYTVLDAVYYMQIIPP